MANEPKLPIPAESWLKIALPAYPVLFTIFGIGFYWGDNPAPLLAPSLAFWGLVVLFYLFSHLYTPKRYPLFIVIGVSVLWLVSAITAHNLGKFVASSSYKGIGSLMSNKDFWYSYTCAVATSLAGLLNFIRYEPLIVKEIESARARASAQS